MHYPTVGIFDYFYKIYFDKCHFDIPGWQVLPDNIDLKDQSPDVFLQINLQKHSNRNSLKLEDLLYKFIKDSGKQILVCESTPFRKNLTNLVETDQIYYRLGWNHYLRSGNFNNKKSPSDRWKKIQQDQCIEIKPWKHNKNGYILLCLQKPLDSSLNTLYQQYSNYEHWIADAIENIRSYTDRHIVVRMHKKRKGLDLSWLENYKNVSVSKNVPLKIYEGGESLQKDFEDAAVVIAYNSNVLVESVCEGIPSVALDHDSNAWPVCNLLSNIESPNLNIDRTQWLHNLAYTTWTKEEILNGTAWEHLRPVYF